MQLTFEFLSQFAQSWAIAGMAVFFGLVILWAFRPGNRAVYDEAARSIFRHDSQPASQIAEQRADGVPARASGAAPVTPSAAKGA